MTYDRPLGRVGRFGAANTVSIKLNLLQKSLPKAVIVAKLAPDLVVGTLDQGFALARSLESALQRAIFMMFLVAEVHPFADGNGRTARIMMNAELVAAGEQRIIIPTVYCNDYLSALRALMQSSEPTPLVRTLDYVQRWTNAMPWGTIKDTQLAMEACNAFYDPNKADRDGIRLQMPDR